MSAKTRLDAFCSHNLTICHPVILNQIIQRFRGEGIGATLARGSIGALAVKVFGTGIAFVLQILLARILGAENYGDYVYALTWMNMLILLGKAGMDIAALRFVAAYAGKNDWGYLHGFIRRGGQLVLMSSLIAAMVLSGGVLALQHYLRPELVAVFIVAAFILPINAFMAVVGAMVQGLKFVVWALAPQEILRPILIGAGVFTLALGGSFKVSAPHAMAVNLASTMLVLLLLIAVFLRKIPAPVKKVAPAFDSRHWLTVTLPLFIISVCNFLFSQTGVIMVGFFLGTKESGIYAVANRIATLITMGPLAVTTIAAPMIAQLHAQERKQELQRLTTLSAWGIFAISLPVGGFIILAGNDILTLFGPEFTGGYSPLVILTMGALANALAGTAGYLMTMTGRQMEIMIMIGGFFILTVILNTLFIPTFGLIGAPLATVPILALWQIVLVLRVRKHLGINSTVIGKFGSFRKIL